MRHRLAALVVLAATAAHAQGPAPEAARPVVPGLSDSTRVSLLTMLPGDEVYSLFGHSALRIADPASGIDRTYNFGTFDFEQPFFVLRFLRGSLEYVLDTAPFWAELQKYQYLERPIIEQTLDVGPAGARALYARLEENALPQNRAYRYDFFWDNCSTRLLVALDSALADVGQPAVALPPPDDPQTFRALLEPYLAASPLLEAGIDLGLGAPADGVATAREETFLPLELAAQLDRASVGGRPLVASRDTLFWVEGAGLPERSFPWPLLLTVVLAAAALGRMAAGRWGRLGDAALYGTVGLAGLVLALLWLGTEHRVTGPNWNVLWAWPTHLGAAWALARARPGPRWRVYFGATAAVAAVTLVLWPLWPQALPVPLAPVIALLAVRSGLLARRPRGAEAGVGAEAAPAGRGNP